MGRRVKALAVMSEALSHAVGIIVALGFRDFPEWAMPIFTFASYAQSLKFVRLGILTGLIFEFYKTYQYVEY
jgi:hypothetical protein